MDSLKKAKIIGFFSIPSSSLAEHNPTAYNNAMKDIPNGAGVCSYCGRSIMHHVVIKDENDVTRFIGTECANKIGCDSEQIRNRLTDEEKEARKARWEKKMEEQEKKRLEQEESLRLLKIQRREMVGDIIDMLYNLGGDFYTSLAEQLSVKPLSDRQAHFVAKATSSTGRRNKKNANAWDEIIERCVFSE
jgi:hypothetical protein